MKTSESLSSAALEETPSLATRWSLIRAARGDDGSENEARQAMETVVQRYRPLILSFIRKNGVNPADCEDLCHDYLFQNFQENVLRSADPEKGRFRTFMFHTLRAFLSSNWRKVNAAKRGGGRVVSMEDAFPQGDHAGPVDVGLSRQELQFEIDWALSMQEDVLGSLRGQYRKRGEEAVFEALFPHLLETPTGIYNTLSAELGRDAAAVRKALSRLRERYVELMLERVREESYSNDEDPKTELKEILKLVLVARSRQAAA